MRRRQASAGVAWAYCEFVSSQSIFPDHPGRRNDGTHARKVAVEYRRLARHLKDLKNVTQSVQHAPGIQDEIREEWQVLLSARPRKSAEGGRLAPPRIDPHCAGIGAAQLRRQESHRRARAPARRLAG